jgi:DnaJ homolog subfamily A member 2
MIYLIGGDEHKFKELNAAYQILSDPETRSKYDRLGFAGIASVRNGNGSPNDDLFSVFSHGKRVRRGDDVNRTLSLTLEDLYMGKTIKFTINRSVRVGAPALCKPCDGKGVVLELRQIALGMVQQLQRRCQECTGEGYMCQFEKECKAVEIHVERGMAQNDKIVLRGMADEKLNAESGNINFIVQVKDHSVFTRKGVDLMMRKTLSLNEALCGFIWKFSHLDGREIVIKSKPGEIIRTTADSGQPYVKVLKGEGMPVRGNMFVKGNLYVMFAIQFPKENELSNDIVDLLRKVLPNPSSKIDYDDTTTDVVHLALGDIKNFGSGQISTSNSNSYDEDGIGIPQQPTCQQS